MNLRVLEDTPTLHHVVVCTLCSCYPRPLLGHSPYWYRSPNYRRRIIRWPRSVLAELGLNFLPTWRCGSRTPTRNAGSWSATGRHRELDRGAAGGNRDPRLHDWRCLAAVRPEDRRCSADPQSGPGRSIASTMRRGPPNE
jgi:hypothetical protein